MGRFSRYIGSQFSEPRGFVGSICRFIMNNINKKQYNAEGALKMFLLSKYLRRVYL